jgi:predicted kinase
MDAARQHEEQNNSSTLVVPQRTLLVLCGPAGSGKSTFADQLVNTNKHNELKPTAIVSSDTCRGLVCDDDNNQQASRDAFDLFYFIIDKRMSHSRFTIADSTALLADTRRRILEGARRHQYFTCLLIFNISPDICLMNDQKRTRAVGKQVIDYHSGLLKQTLLAVPDEGWNQIHIINEQSAIMRLEIAPA